jgi:hypothetical protein
MRGLARRVIALSKVGMMPDAMRDKCNEAMKHAMRAETFLRRGDVESERESWRLHDLEANDLEGMLDEADGG